MINDNFTWLFDWYHKQCDGDWEHGHTIKIATLDNPGWSLKICLSETELAGKDLQIVNISRAEDDWIYCSIKNEIFEGFGGPFNLPEILQIFRNWAESSEQSGS